MNGYVEVDGQKHLWIGKRSDTKQTYPGMLDHLVAGGLVCIFVFLCSKLKQSPQDHYYLLGESFFLWLGTEKF